MSFYEIKQNIYVLIPITTLFTEFVNDGTGFHMSKNEDNNMIA
jgi:hypothetical protein